MDLSAKLQLKPGQHVEIVDAPEPLAPSLAEMGPVGDEDDSAALVVFVADRATLEARRVQITRAATGGRLTWVAYPKAGQLGTDLNRDSLATLLTERGVQPVRQVAIDDVWSALRFRPG